MAYQTGTASSVANLISIINTFAAANGWTQSAAVLGVHGVLSAGSGSVEMYADATKPDNKIMLRGASANDMATNLNAQGAATFINTDHWPVTYHLFAHTTPHNQVICVVNFAGIYHNWIAFGDFTKYATFTGGNYFAASWGAQVSFENDIAMEDYGVDDGSLTGYTAMSGSFFWECNNHDAWGGGFSSRRNSFVRAHIDGYTWPGAYPDEYGLYPQFSQMAYQLYYSDRQPNVWDLHAVLLPYVLFMPRSDGTWSAIGHIDNVNYLRVTYFEPGEIITIGSDKFMVFPFFRKKVSAPNGYGSDGQRDSSGTHGWAIRYDGP